MRARAVRVRTSLLLGLVACTCMSATASTFISPPAVNHAAGPIVAYCNSRRDSRYVHDSRNDEIREGVFLSLLGHYGMLWPDVKVYYLAIGNGDPDSDLLCRLWQHKIAVQKYSQRNTQTLSEVKGVIFRLQDIHWRKHQGVSVRYFVLIHGRGGVGGISQVIHVRGRWRVTNETIDKQY